MIRIENKKTYRGDGVYIGRPSRLGNPFRIGEHGMRDEVVAKYKIWLWQQIKQRGAVYHELRRLAEVARQGDLVLICWYKRQDRQIVGVMLVLAVAASCGSYAYHVYSLFRDAQRNIPQPQIEKLVKDFRLFHSRTKRFPRNFTEINDYLWHTRPTPNYGAEGRQARVKNYYYFIRE